MTENEITEVKNGAITAQEKVEYTGFEEANVEDSIVPRIKVINALSPERVDGEAQEGDVINSLTKMSVAGVRFIPFKIYYSNIEWNPDRDDDENRMFCRSFDGKTGETNDGTCLSCKICKKNQFDNTKTGKDAQPTCTAYLNFLGFFENDPMPAVLSFSKTSYNEGKKMLSIAKSMRKSLWAYSYLIGSKQLTKGKQKWYVPSATMASATTAEEQVIATEFFKAYQERLVNSEYDDETRSVKQSVIIDKETEEEI